MTPETLVQRLARYPRRRDLLLPTPLEPLDHLTARLAGPRLWIKRDDGIGPATGGNKGRKLEFLMAEIEARQKRKVITYGGLQSNHARMTAAACAALGLEAHLFFFDRRPPLLDGNLLLDQLSGAQLHFIPFGGGSDGTLSLEWTNRLVRLVALARVGPGAYFMPVGGHSVTGCLGYVNAAIEIAQQIERHGLAPERTTIVTAAGTGGTLAGLFAGLRLLQSPVRILGLDIGKLWRGFASSVARLAGELSVALEEPHTFTVDALPLIEKQYAGAGYARMSEGVVAAIRLMARTEGILLDPVYTGKAFAGLLDLVAQGWFAREEHVIFLHTGGLPGLWAFAGQLDSE